jgi:hypothetical protein
MTWRKVFRDVLEPEQPPEELDREQRRRYYVSYGTLVLLCLVVSVLGLAGGVAGYFWYVGGTQAIEQAFRDAAYARQFGDTWFLIGLASGVAGFFAALALWDRIFVKSGYLSPAAQQRLATSRAPTERGERMRVGIGYVVYLTIFFGLGIPMALYAERTPVNVFAMIGLNGLGVFTAIHAYLRYRKRGNHERPSVDL